MGVRRSRRLCGWGWGSGRVCANRGDNSRAQNRELGIEFLFTLHDETESSRTLLATIQYPVHGHSWIITYNGHPIRCYRRKCILLFPWTDISEIFLGAACSPYLKSANSTPSPSSAVYHNRHKLPALPGRTGFRVIHSHPLSAFSMDVKIRECSASTYAISAPYHHVLIIISPVRENWKTHVWFEVATQPYQGGRRSPNYFPYQAQNGEKSALGMRTIDVRNDPKADAHALSSSSA